MTKIRFDVRTNRARGKIFEQDRKRMAVGEGGTAEECGTTPGLKPQKSGWSLIFASHAQRSAGCAT